MAQHFEKDKNNLLFTLILSLTTFSMQIYSVLLLDVLSSIL